MATDSRRLLALPALLATLVLVSACRTPQSFESEGFDASFSTDPISLTDLHGAREITQSDSVETTPAPETNAVTATEHIDTHEPLRLLPPPTEHQAPSTIQLVSAQEELPPKPEFEPPDPDSIAIPEFLPDSRIVQEMTIDELVEYARANHPLLAARYGQTDVARARLVAAGKFVNPDFVLDTETPVQFNGPTELSMRLTMPLPTAHKRRYRQSVAWAEIRRTQLTASKEEAFIVRGVVDRAVEVLYLQNLVNLHEQLSELAQKRADSLIQPIRPGGASVNLVDQVEADMEAVEARSQKLDAVRRLRVTRMQLAQAVGMSPDFFVSVAGELDSDLSPLLSLDSVLAIARQRNPEIAEALAMVAESRSQYCLQRAMAVPDLDIGPRFQDPIGVDRDQIGGRIRFDVPIFDRNEGGILEAAAQIRTNQSLVDVAELNSIHLVGAAYLELESLRESLQYQESEVQEIVRRNRERIENPNIRNLVGEDQILEIRQHLLQTQLQALADRYRYFQLVRQLEVLLGQSLYLEDSFEDEVPGNEPTKE